VNRRVAIASTQIHSGLDRQNADAITVNPYLGRETLEPFLERCRDGGKGIYVLVKTSNQGSADFQDVELLGGGLKVMAATHRGTRVTAWLPVEVCEGAE